MIDFLRLKTYYIYCRPGLTQGDEWWATRALLFQIWRYEAEFLLDIAHRSSPIASHYSF